MASVRPSKVCIGCGATYYKGYRENASKWNIRKFCGLKCLRENANGIIGGTKPRKTLEERISSAQGRGISTRANFGRIIKDFYMDRCCICGWNEASCEVAHIISVSAGGKNEVDNVVILCPNHHKMFDENKISVDEVMRARDNMILKPA